jgi:hypothetical protein
MATFTFEEQRLIMLFLHLRDMKRIEFRQQLSETFNDGIMDVKMCVCGYDSSKMAERLVKTIRRSFGHSLADLKT